jgi:integrase
MTTSRRTRRNFGHVRKLPSGKFQASYLVNGERFTAPTTFETKIDAGTFLAVTQTKIISGKWMPHIDAPSTLNLQAYADPWLADRDIKPGTRALYRRLLDQRILPVLGDRPLVTITAADIRAWHADQGTETPTARAHAYALLRSILQSAVNDDLLVSNSCHIRGGSVVKRASKTVIATPQELKIIIDNIPERFHLMIMLAAWCAMRSGELTELRVKDLDLKRGHVNIDRAVTVVGSEFIEGDPKSDAGTRGVSIPPHIMPLVRQHLNDHVNQFDQEALLFPANGGGHLGHGNFWAIWDKARKAAGRPDLRLHDLRHTGLTLYALEGATVAELMARAGHTTPKMAMRYQHIVEGRDVDLVRRMSTRVNGE